jgi:phosphoribosylformylglycinamidine (FGAM) synthase-like amidotransferase family enzyme
LKYICKTVGLKVETSQSAYTESYNAGDVVDIPIAHHDGNYFADDETIARLQGEDRVAFTYTDNPNGAKADIAGILSANRRVLGMMPHPERAADAGHGGTDGQALFRALAGVLIPA